MCGAKKAENPPRSAARAGARSASTAYSTHGLSLTSLIRAAHGTITGTFNWRSPATMALTDQGTCAGPSKTTLSCPRSSSTGRTTLRRDELHLFVFHPPALRMSRAGDIRPCCPQAGRYFSLPEWPKTKLFAGREARTNLVRGMDASQPRWGSLSEKKCVLENPDGTGWRLSAVYNHGIKRYLLATEHTASHAGLMALFDAPEPWGPWTTVRYWRPDEPFGSTRSGSKLDWDNNVFFFSFAPKWFSPDGRNFTLVFTGGGHGKNNDSFNTVRGVLVALIQG